MTILWQENVVDLDAFVTNLSQKRVRLPGRLVADPAINHDVFICLLCSDLLLVPSIRLSWDKYSIPSDLSLYVPGLRALVLNQDFLVFYLCCPALILI